MDSNSAGDGPTTEESGRGCVSPLGLICSLHKGLTSSFVACLELPALLCTLPSKDCKKKRQIPH